MAESRNKSNACIQTQNYAVAMMFWTMAAVDRTPKTARKAATQILLTLQC